MNKIIDSFLASNDLLSDYIATQTNFLHSKIKEIEDDLKTKCQLLEIEEQINLSNSYNEFHLDFLEGTFPDIQTKGNIVIFYSNFETTLMKLCISYNQKEFTRVGKKSVVEECLLFLIKENQIKKEALNSNEWQCLDVIRKIRNSIAHKNSNITYIIKHDYHQLKIFLKGMNGVVLISKNDETYISFTKPDFLFVFIEKSSLLFQNFVINQS